MEAFIHIEAYAGAARGVDSYAIAQLVVAERASVEVENRATSESNSDSSTGQ